MVINQHTHTHHYCWWYLQIVPWNASKHLWGTAGTTPPWPGCLISALCVIGCWLGWLVGSVGVWLGAWFGLVLPRFWLGIRWLGSVRSLVRWYMIRVCRLEGFITLGGWLMVKAFMILTRHRGPQSLPELVRTCVGYQADGLFNGHNQLEGLTCLLDWLVVADSDWILMVDDWR